MKVHLRIPFAMNEIRCMRMNWKGAMWLLHGLPYHGDGMD